MARTIRSSRSEDREFAKALKAGRSATISVEQPKTRLGFSPTLATASGAGSHGKAKKARARSERQQARRDLRSGADGW